MTTRIGLFFGSFNPVHIGHMIIANYMATQTDLAEVWMVVSPHNPHKDRQSLARDHDRLHLVRLAIGDNPNIRASDIEFSMPQPSYTTDTLIRLREKYPDKSFVLIMGSDTLATLPRWKNAEVLMRDYECYVYKRPDATPQAPEAARVRYFDAPLMQISASYIRQCIENGHSIQYLVPEAVHDYLSATSLYRKRKG